MQKEKYSAHYQKVSEKFNHDSGIRMIKLTNTVLTALFYAAYVLLLVLIFLWKREDLIKMILVPGICFCSVSLIRDHMNFSRPYEDGQIRPLIQKDTTGNSMPSRHVFSASLIAVLYLYAFGWPGWILLVLAALSGVIRVLAGVHYPADVICGYILGILCGCIVFIV